MKTCNTPLRIIYIYSLYSLYCIFSKKRVHVKNIKNIYNIGLFSAEKGNDVFLAKNVYKEYNLRDKKWSKHQKNGKNISQNINVLMVNYILQIYSQLKEHGRLKPHNSVVYVPFCDEVSKNGVFE